VAEIKALLRGGDECDLGGGLRGRWEPGNILVTFPNGRQQTVRYERRGERYLFTSRVATQGQLQHLSWKELSREILRRNRMTKVVAFGIKNWYAVDAWIEQRASTLRAEKLRFYLRLLAREADRFEFLLTGKDVY
jgi:hypothetical protein